MNNHRKILVLILSVMLVFTLMPTAVFAEGDESAETPELVPQTLWTGTESWGSPQFRNVSDMNSIEVTDITSDNTSVLRIMNTGGEESSIRTYLLDPVSPGTAVVTVTFTLDGTEYTLSGEYTVKEFPVFVSSLTIDGVEQNTGNYYYHNYYDIDNYEETSADISFTVAEGWTLDFAYGYMQTPTGLANVIIDASYLDEGWALDFPEKNSALRAFFEFSNVEGDSIQFGIRFSRPEGGVDPGDKTILDTIEITNINTEIIPGEKAVFTAELLSDNMSIVNERWFKTDQTKILTGGTDDLPEVGEEYKYFITVKVDEGYSFAEDPTVKYNGEVVDAEIHVDSETNLSITGIIPDVTVTEQEEEEPEEMAVDFYDTTGNLTWYWIPEYGPTTYELRINNAGKTLPETPCATKYIESGNGPFYFMIYQEITKLLNDYTLNRTEAYHVSLRAVNEQGKVFQEWETDNLVFPMREFTDDTVSLNKTEFAYTGNQVTISGHVMYNGVLLSSGAYSTSYPGMPKDIGDVTVSISGNENYGYYGTVTKTYKIKGDFSRASTAPNVTLDPEEEYVYTGEPVEPTVISVKFAGLTLTEGQDYTVSYADNNAAGTGYVIISAVEDSYYMGEKQIPFTITEGSPAQEITAVYERVTPFEVIMERDFRDYGDGLQYCGETINCPDAGDKVTFTFPDGTVKHFEYQAGTSYYTGKFVNTEDATETIPWNQTHINILAQAYDWEPGGDKNYYEVEFLNYPEDGDLFSCRVPIEVSSTPVASVEYEPVPVLLWANDAGRSGMPAGSKVTVTYKDGTSEVFVDDYETHGWISQETKEPIPANDNIYYKIWIERDREDLSCTASYMGVTSEKNYGALYVAQSISLHQEEPMVLKKGKNSSTMTDAAGNEYENYALDGNNWFGENDVLTIKYKNGMGDIIDVDYVTDSETSFGLAEDSPYYSGNLGDDHLSANYITIHMPDQSENHFEIGQTYRMDMTYHVVGSNFEYPAFTTEGEPYKVLIKEAGPEDVTSVSFTSGSSIAKVKKGETLQLAVSWEPSYANVPADAITWVSTNPSVATIDGNGLVTAVSEGSTQITAQIGDRIAYKNVEVYEEKILTDETVSLSQTVFPYTGTTVNVDGCVLYNGEPVPRTYCSFNYTAIGAEGQPPREIGDYKVVITGSYGGYSGSATEYFTIKGDLTRNATNLNVTLDAEEYTYSGTPVEPKVVSVTAKGKGGGIATLVEGQDYTVSYMNNTAAGTGFVIISAIEDSYYRGEKMIPFTITEAVKDGWIREGDDWYYYENGNMVTSKWRKDGDDWCYLGPDGKRVSSKWQKDSKGWCYLGADGKMVTNDWVKDTKGYCWIAADGYMPNVTKWIQYEGSWYHITNGYRDESKWMKDSKGWCWLQADGKMLTNGWAKDSKGYCWIGASGYMVTDTKWIDVDGTRYYIKSGYMAVNCWAKDDKGWLYLGADGQPVKNTWKKDAKGWCYVGEDGYMIANGWAKDSKGWCWLASNGYMPVETKWVKYEGDWYHITKGYRDESKWMKDSKGWCWLQADGKMLTNGWAKDSKGWCWIAANGYMPVETGWVEYEGDKYYIEKGYRAESKWLELDGHKFYLKEDGRMAHDEVVTIDSIQYLFDENGYFVGAGG